MKCKVKSSKMDESNNENEDDFDSDVDLDKFLEENSDIHDQGYFIFF